MFVLVRYRRGIDTHHFSTVFKSHKNPPLPPPPTHALTIMHTYMHVPPQTRTHMHTHIHTNTHISIQRERERERDQPPPSPDKNTFTIIATTERTSLCSLSWPNGSTLDSSDLAVEGHFEDGHDRARDDGVCCPALLLLLLPPVSCLKYCAVTRAS